MSSPDSHSSTATARRKHGTPLSRAMRPLNNVVERFIPSALVFSILLTFVVVILALILTDTAPGELVLHWGNGLAGLLDFITQMALILLFGHMLANTGPVQRGLAFLGSVPRTELAAYVFVFLGAAFASLITWGLGLVVGGLLAREVAYQGGQRGLKLHFPMLVASGFAGFVVWHMGYSASGPLTAATPDSFLAESLGGQTVPISQTVFSGWNMIAAVVTIVVVGLSLYLVAPRKGDNITEFKIDTRQKVDDGQEDVVTPADRLDASRIVTLLLGLMLVAYLVLHFVQGGTLTLDTVNWSFLALILLLVRNPFELIALTKNAAPMSAKFCYSSPVCGHLGADDWVWLIQIFSEAFVSISNPVTFGLLAFLSAGLVNFFVPSGGGQFAVQGPIMLSAGAELGVAPEITILAVAYGDQWTNMIQPFWAIPLLAIAGLKMRDILGYTTIVLIASGLVFGGTLLLVSL